MLLQRVPEHVPALDLTTDAAEAKALVDAGYSEPLARYQWRLRSGGAERFIADALWSGQRFRTPQGAAHRVRP